MSGFGVAQSLRNNDDGSASFSNCRMNYVDNDGNLSVFQKCTFSQYFNQSESGSLEVRNETKK